MRRAIHKEAFSDYWSYCGKCKIAPSTSGGLWGVYGYGGWPSYSTWLVPGTLENI